MLGQIDNDISNHSGFSTVLYVGHGYTNGSYGHIDPSGNPSNPEDHSTTNRFVFNWVCKGNWNAPEAWNPLCYNDPSTYGDYVWIGFHDASPWLREEMSYQNNHKNWLVFFYYYAVNQFGYAVAEALDLASICTGFNDYDSCIIRQYETYWPYNESAPDKRKHGGMVYAGNPNSLVLPHSIRVS